MISKEIECDLIKEHTTSEHTMSEETTSEEEYCGWYLGNIRALFFVDLKNLLKTIITYVKISGDFHLTNNRMRRD